MSRADLGGGGCFSTPLQVYSTPVQSFAGTGKSCSSVSLDNLFETATVKEGRMEARVVTKRLGDGR